MNGIDIDDRDQSGEWPSPELDARLTKIADRIVAVVQFGTPVLAIIGTIALVYDLVARS